MGERRTSDGSVLEPGCLFVETRAIRAEQEEEEADRQIGDTTWGYYPTSE